MINSERPGVYTSYEISGVRYSGAQGAKTVGIAAESATGEVGTVYDITSYASAVGVFGAGSKMSELIRILILNGAALIKAVSVGQSARGEEYDAAFKLLGEQESVSFIICGSTDSEVHEKLRDSLLTLDERYSYKIGIVETNGTVAEAVEAAKKLNCERVAMVTNEGERTATGSVAAAFTGVLAAETDPAIPYNGALMFGINGAGRQYSDAEITLLIKGGVTPVENMGGAVSVVRAVTTKSMTQGVTDTTWRELNTILVVDDVIPTVRDSLRRMFSRTKNTAQTRGAMRTQVIIELEKKVTQQIIESYGNVTAVQNQNDPTVCDVGFEFTVAHGLNQVRLVAYITV